MAGNRKSNKKTGKIRDLKAKALNPRKAGSVKGGATLLGGVPLSSPLKQFTKLPSLKGKFGAVGPPC
jgi:hypothetical protein